MVFDEKFIEGLPDDVVEATLAVCSRATEFLQKHANPNITALTKSPGYDGVVEIHAFFTVLRDRYKQSWGVAAFVADRNTNVQNVWNLVNALTAHFQKAISDRTIESHAVRFRRLFAKEFAYEFTDGDLARIQQLLNELRDMVVESTKFAEDHRQRVLRRLEKLQGELHKKVSDLDRFWGLVGEAGVAVGKFGKDAKPFVDRIKEVADIIWRTQAHAEQLPSDAHSPLLEYKPGKIDE